MVYDLFYCIQAQLLMSRWPLRDHEAFITFCYFGLKVAVVISSLNAAKKSKIAKEKFNLDNSRREKTERERREMWRSMYYVRGRQVRKLIRRKRF